MAWMRTGLKVFVRFAGVAAAVAIASWAGPSAALAFGDMSPVSLPSGVAMGLLAVLGIKHWPAILVGSLLGQAGEGMAVASSAAIGDTLEALLGAFLLQHLGVRGEIGRPREAMAVVGIAALAPLVSLLVYFGAVAAGINLPQPPLLPVFVARWAADALGILVVVPPLMGWLGSPQANRMSERWWEFFAVLGCVALGVSGLFFGQAEIAELGISKAPRSLFILPPLLWAALRLRPRGAATALATMAVAAAFITASGYGPFAHGRPLFGLLEMQLMLIGMITPVLVLIGGIAERDGALAELEAARQRADEANAAKTRFVAAVRHDLSQPLQAIQLFLGALSSQPLTRQGRVTLDRTAAGIDSMVAALNALKDITSVECELIRPQNSVFRADELLSQLAAESAALAVEKGIAFRYVACGVMIESDRALLGRILRNLLANALRYTAQGKVLLGCRRHARGVLIEVWDTGPGIAPEDRDRIFEAFYRAGSAPRPDGGLGLGLATVRRLSAVLGAEVSVRSMVGKGSTFSVLIPYAQPEQQVAA